MSTERRAVSITLPATIEDLVTRLRDSSGIGNGTFTDNRGKETHCPNLLTTETLVRRFEGLTSGNRDIKGRSDRVDHWYYGTHLATRQDTLTVNGIVIAVRHRFVDVSSTEKYCVPNFSYELRGFDWSNDISFQVVRYVGGETGSMLDVFTYKNGDRYSFCGGNVMLQDEQRRIGRVLGLWD